MIIDIFNNSYISDEKKIITPKDLKSQFPLSETGKFNITEFRQTISDIIHGRDQRLLVICGPCSIHDVDAALDYAHRLKNLSIELIDQLYIVMRVYFEKPRTSVGWKGLINDPYMDGSFDIEAGLQIARRLLLELIKMEVPLATEILDLNSPQYLGDLFSWSVIGARTTESQLHREIASGLSTPVGFKNNTEGSIIAAINAIRTAAISHRFIGINQTGHACLLKTRGNSDSHVILRGGKQPNYYPQNIIYYERQIIEAGLPVALMIDCSHGNSNKDYRLQTKVAYSVLKQIKDGNRSIIGLMLESYIHAGNQSLQLPRKKMLYGVSVTDACIDWKSTDILLRQLHSELKNILPIRRQSSISKETIL